jgi:hypothetical protein
MSERDHQDAIIEAARTLGYLVHHDRPARREDGTWATHVQGDPGFPDLVIAGYGHIFFVELKVPSNRMTKAQHEWMTFLQAAADGDRVEAFTLYVPEGQEQFIQTLNDLRTRYYRDIRF